MEYTVKRSYKVTIPDHHMQALSTIGQGQQGLLEACTRMYDASEIGALYLIDHPVFHVIWGDEEEAHLVEEQLKEDPTYSGKVLYGPIKDWNCEEE